MRGRKSFEGQNGGREPAGLSGAGHHGTPVTRVGPVALTLRVTCLTSVCLRCPYGYEIRSSNSPALMPLIHWFISARVNRATAPSG